MSRLASALECPVCLGRYADPRVLGCGHSFCLPCVEPLFEYMSVRCPKCRRVTDMQESCATDGLPRSFALCEVLEAVGEGELLLPGGEGQGSGPGVRRSISAKENDIDWRSIVDVHCDKCAFNRETGVLSRVGRGLIVGQFISARPITADTSVHIDILDPGSAGRIYIGIVPENYPLGTQPGWRQASVAYSAEDGGLYHGSSIPLDKKDENKCTFGNRMGFSVRYSSDGCTVTFTKDEEQVYSVELHSEQKWFPMVGLSSEGEKVQLVDEKAWVLDESSEAMSSAQFWRQISFKKVSLCILNKSTGILRYGDMFGRVSQLIGAHQILPPASFSLEIINEGQATTISIGLVPRVYEDDRQPGWDVDSVAYHADDGGLFHQSGWHNASSSRCCQGDTMKCEVKVENEDTIVTFYKNNNLEHTVNLGHWNHDTNPLFPAVGMHSAGEMVQLRQCDVWMHTNDKTAPI